MRRPGVRLALLLVLGGALVVPMGASPQPTPVCSACGFPFERVAGSATVQESAVVVQVHENGSATWTVRNRLANESEIFRENSDRLDAAASSAARRGEGPSDGLRPVDARLENGTAVLVFQDDDAAHRHAGLLVVQYFHERGHEYRYHLNADSFTVRGPAGTVVTNEPPGASVDGRNATWSGRTHGASGMGEPLRADAYVVFGPDRSAVTGARTTAAVGLATFPIVVRTVTGFAVLPGLIFAGVLAGVSRLARRYDEDTGIGALAAGALLAAAFGFVLVPRLLGVGSLTLPAVVVLVITGLAVLPRTRPLLTTPRRQALGALVALGVGLAVTIAVFPPRDETVTATGSDVLTVSRLLATALPFAAAFPFGGALAAGVQSRRLPWAALVVLGFAVGVLGFVGPTDPPSGLAGGIFTMLAFVAALAVPLLLAPLVALGHALARRVRSP